MNKEFHYWITGIIADHAGFSQGETATIAYSSQYVDDNDDDILVYDNELSPTPAYRNHVSQTLNFLMPRTDLMEIYPLFHFIPGDQAKAAARRDGKTNALNATPDSSHANAIMEAALKSAAARYQDIDPGGLYRIGIATHSLADTWAHQNFTGTIDDFNAIGCNLLPNVGHADAMHHPDWVSHRWTDDRMEESTINNNVRFLAAARRIYTLLAGFRAGLGKPPATSWGDLEALLLGIFGITYSGADEQGAEARIRQYRQRLHWLADYDDGAWLQAALERKTVVRVDNDDYEERYFWKRGVDRNRTDWFLFQEAVKEHVAAAKGVLQGVLPS